MSPALSIRVFGWYLIALGLALVTMPNVLLGMFSIPATGEVWIRVVGMLVGLLGVYYLVAVREGWREFFRWTVWLRSAVLVFFAAFVALGWAPWPLLLFGVFDVLGAAWTWVALRRAA